MDRKGLLNGSIFSFIKFFLFLIILCFLVELSKEFFNELKNIEEMNNSILFLSVLSPFAFYTFFADLSDFYKKIQAFFFRTSFFEYLIPSILILSGISFFIFPRIFNFSFNKNLFVFIGGIALTMHLIFIASQIKGSTFTDFIDYLFYFSILCIINIILLGLYLKVAFPFPLGEIIVDGIKNGAFLINSLFTEILRPK